MENVLKHAFNLIIEERVKGTALVKDNQTPAFTETNKIFNETLSRLKESFTTEEQGKRFQEVEEAWMNQKTLSLHHAYRQGLEDSVVLQDVLKKYERLAK